MSIVKPSHCNDDRNNPNAPVAEGQINLKFRLSRKTIALLLGAFSTFASGFAAGSLHAQNSVREATPREVSQPQLDREATP